MQFYIVMMFSDFSRMVTMQNLMHDGGFSSTGITQKLIDKLTEQFDQIYIHYKLIYDEVIEGYLFTEADFAPYFLEPITYREVEWIEIPSEYQFWVNRNNLKAGKKIYTQDPQAMLAAINKMGKFRIDEFENSIRLYGYI